MSQFNEASIESDTEQRLAENSEMPFQALSFQELIEQAKRFVEGEQWDEAIASYQKALAIQPVPQAWVYLALGPLLVRKGRVVEAIDCYKRAIALNPKNARTYALLGIALEEKQLISGAISSYQKAINIDPNQPAWVPQRLATVLCKRAQTDYQQAAIRYIQAMQLQDRFVNFDLLHQTLDKLYGSRDEYTEESLHSLWQSLETTDPKSFVFAKRLTKLGFLTRSQSPINPAGYYFINERLKTVYCSIPKNACTLFKTMLVDNSELKEEFEVSGKSIHEFLNQKTGQTSANHLLDCLSSDEYFKFVVLRNPFDRIVSGYLDKFAKHVIPETFVQEIILNVQASTGLEPDIEKSITFSAFIDYLLRTPDNHLNDHWRPQHNFISAVEFDFIGQFEAINVVVDTLESKFNMHIRKQVSSHITQYETFDNSQDFHKMYPWQLRQLGGFPTALQMFSAELRNKIETRYREDCVIFNNAFKNFL